MQYNLNLSFLETVMIIIIIMTTTSEASILDNRHYV